MESQEREQRAELNSAKTQSGHLILGRKEILAPAALWKNLEFIMQSEINHPERDTC